MIKPSSKKLRIFSSLICSRFMYFLYKGPKLLARFDSLYEEKKSPASGNDSEGNLFALEAFGMIFEGLADCLTTPRKTSEVRNKTEETCSCQVVYCNCSNSASG